MVLKKPFFHLEKGGGSHYNQGHLIFRTIQYYGNFDQRKIKKAEEKTMFKQKATCRATTQERNMKNEKK